MKRLLKRVIFLSILAAVGLVAFRLVSRRRAEPAEPYSWSPPPTPPPAVHVEVHPPETQEADPTGEVPTELESVALEEALDAPTAPPIEAEAGPPAGAAPEADPAQDPEFLTKYFDILAETPDEELLERLAGMAEPGLELVPEAPTTQARPLFTPPPPPELTHKPTEPVAHSPEKQREAADPVTRREEPAAVVEPATAAESPPDLPQSLEAALTELAPMPIVPPPRRTAESYLDEGNVYFNVGQYQLAVERYSTAVEMDRDLVAAYYNRANARTRSGDFEAALSDYDRALVLQPFDADALNNRGMLHLYRANYADALRDFNAALVIDPADTTVMVNRGLAHLHSGNAINALQDFREAVAVDNEDAAAHYGASQASAVLGNTDDALRSVSRALELNPGYAREAAGDPNLASLQGDAAFLKLLRDSGAQ